MRIISQPASVAPEDIKAFFESGYKSVDETQVVRIETNKYFDFLMSLITASGIFSVSMVTVWEPLVIIIGGSIELGTRLTKQDLDKMKKSGHVVNCLGSNQFNKNVIKYGNLANNAGTVGGSAGTYYSNPGEVVIWGRCPRDFAYYVMDDDKDAGVMMTRDGKLYLSTAAEAGEDQTKMTVADCDGVCQALFGEKLSLSSGDGYESWKTDRPMRKEGFNIGAEKSSSGLVSAENSGHGGAGVAASWACAALASDRIVEFLGRNW